MLTLGNAFVGSVSSLTRASELTSGNSKDTLRARGIRKRERTFIHSTGPASSEG